jgi:RNA polymerase sigma-70 factor (ECF subfamily)
LRDNRATGNGEVALEQALPELAELLAEVSRGDRQAFRMLYDRTSAKLFGVVLRIVRNRELADEVLQEAYLRIWQAAARFEPESGRPMTWMISIARYAAIDLIRRRTDARLRAAGDQDDHIKNIAAPDDQERDLMLQQELLRCLGQLAEPQRNAVLLAYCSGHSREELAEHFNAPVPTVKTWLRRSLIALRLCLEGS